MRIATRVGWKRWLSLALLLELPWQGVAAANPAGPPSAEVTSTKGPAVASVEVEPPPAPLRPEASVDEQVDGHVQRSIDAFTSGRYEQSVRELSAAHALDPQPIFLFNIAQSYRRWQRLREALSYYQQFLKADPKTSLRAETRGYIQELSALLEKQEQLERERRKPAWRKPWFWGLVSGGVALVATGLGLGFGLGLRDDRTVIDVQP